MPKIADDRRAKIEIWARESRVHAFPVIAELPRFGVKRFTSYAELNAWKRELLLGLARQGGARWIVTVHGASEHANPRLQ
ncbi:MAG TPA: hypothetical protein DCM87_10365 [Planctomycetes bacterium]|nr:hypothetical protein [Planctomycetota bacterium]